MNKRAANIILFIFLFFFSFPIAAQNASVITGDRFEETIGRGLEIRTNPAGVKIFIDGAERGVSPITFESLQHGEYQIRLSRDGYKDRVFNVTLFSASRLVVSIKMEEERGLIQVSVHKAPDSPDHLPFNPQIFFGSTGDNAAHENFPQTALKNEGSKEVPIFHENNALLNLPAGYQTIRARAFGWEETSVTVLINKNETGKADILMNSAPFSMKNVSQNRRRFNPLNPGNMGENRYSFEVTSPGTGVITIMNNDNDIVFSGSLGVFDTWINHITWNGRDSEDNLLPAGVYAVVIKTTSLKQNQLIHAAGEAAFPIDTDQNDEDIFSFTLETLINYSNDILPLSAVCGISGLTFTPMPHVLSLGSIQIDAGILTGSFLLRQADDSNDTQEINNIFGFPFEINMRISPFKRTELTTSVNINPYLNKQERKMFTGWGISGSLKFNIINENLISFAAGASYEWAGKNGDHPLSPGRGAGLHLPLSFELTNLSLIFCPALFWRGPEGFIPALLLSTGALYKGSVFNAGLSMRCEIDFTENINNSKSPKFFTGAEVHLFPPPSHFVFSFLAGIIYHEQKTGGYGGFKIGIIN